MADTATTMRKVRVAGLNSFFSFDELLNPARAWISFSPVVSGGVVRLPSGDLITTLQMSFPLDDTFVGYVVNPNLEGITPRGFPYHFTISAEGECGKSRIASGILDFSTADSYVDALGDVVVDLTPLLPAATIAYEGNNQGPPSGSLGSPGPRGPQGPIGPTGPRGPKGDKGDRGEMGIGIDFNGVLSSTSDLPGDDSQGSAYIVDQILWVMGAEGEWVRAGEIATLPGEDGRDGRDGASTFDLWLAQGNTGTVLDFLRSIRGEKGLPGLQGTPGVGVAGITQTNTDKFLVTLTDGTATSITMPVATSGETRGRVIDSITAGSDPLTLVVTWSDETTDTITLKTTGESGVTYDDSEIRAEIQGLNESLRTITLTPGPQGPQGERGEKGEKGEPGEDGRAGIDGVPGARGEIGPEGLQGIQGEVGPQGPAGKDGIDGERGPQGIQGEIGPRGLQGIQGEVGPVGPQGLKGDTGAPGTKGDTGPQGPQGPAGSAGFTDVVYTLSTRATSSRSNPTLGAGSPKLYISSTSSRTILSLDISASAANLSSALGTSTLKAGTQYDIFSFDNPLGNKKIVNTGLGNILYSVFSIALTISSTTYMLDAAIYQNSTGTIIDVRIIPRADITLSSTGGNLPILYTWSYPMV